MAGLMDIEKSIVRVLKEKIPSVKISSSDTKEGFGKPSFFTQVVPIRSDYETVGLTSGSVMIAINYFSKSGTELENLIMHDALRKAFGMTLKVGQRHFLCRNIRSEIADSVLQFKFDLDYHAIYEKTYAEETMEYLEVEIQKE